MMNIVLKILIALISIEHLFILWVEMFSWTSLGKKMFKSMPEDLFEKTKTMAANQGLYNGFLATGLIWSIFINNIWAYNIAIFFLSCVTLAGVYGAISASKSIFFKQALPAILVLGVLFITM